MHFQRDVAIDRTCRNLTSGQCQRLFSDFRRWHTTRTWSTPTATHTGTLQFPSCQPASLPAGSVGRPRLPCAASTTMPRLPPPCLSWALRLPTQPGDRGKQRRSNCRGELDEASGCRRSPGLVQTGAAQGGALPAASAQHGLQQHLLGAKNRAALQLSGCTPAMPSRALSVSALMLCCRYECCWTSPASRSLRG